jgi:large subunit ribosomal protein L31
VKEGIHPEWYPEARVVCACGNTWTTGSTVPEIRTDVCSNCHPFYTGEQRIMDTEGQVDRFMKRLEARDRIAAEREAGRASAELPVEQLEIGTRYQKALAEAGITTVGQVIELLDEQGEEGLLAIKGFGRRGLAELKKSLRQRGYEVPEAAL